MKRDGENLVEVHLKPLSNDGVGEKCNFLGGGKGLWRVDGGALRGGSFFGIY